MKLLFCAQCNDVRSLRMHEVTTCKCGTTSGQYINRIDAVINGTKNISFMLGFANNTLAHALRNDIVRTQENNQEFFGECFEAFVIPHNADSVEFNLK